MNEQNTSSTEPVSPPSALSKFRMHWKKMLVAVGAIVVIVAAVFLFQKDDGIFSIKTEYPQIYTLVNDKVSVSAPIQINLPKGVAKEGVEKNIVFEPVLKGAWVSTDLPDVVAFKPEKKLAAGNYYSVTLAANGGEIKKDFQADEDPAIVDIFPKANSEADEASSITIVFNRPMVPLTTLGELEKNKVPVTITPATEGKFKWISTRSLQFIPKTTLVRSAHYEVSVNTGFVSMDGLPVAGVKHQFTTRPLRFEYSTNDTLRYNQPIEFRFNQPVDLERTAKEISLTNNTTFSKVPFDAEFGTRLVYDPERKENVTLEDRSVIRIFPKTDKFNRPHLWDFETAYMAILSKAYPIGGDIAYTNNVTSRVTTTGIIQSVTAQSERTNLASPDLFDPQGKVTVTFYEDIDIKKSDIGVAGLKKIEYGQKCKGEGNTKGYYYNTPCEKIDDKTTLIFSFDETKINTPGLSIPILFKHVVNTEGLALNAEDLIVPLKVFPSLTIYKIVPAEGVVNGSIKELIVCSNSPLKPLSGPDFYSAIKADNYMVLGRWEMPYLQTADSYYRKPPCVNGQYVNTIRYGLLPEKLYTLSLSLVDAFGQTIFQKISFRTEKAPELYLRFHALDKVYNVTTPGKTKLTYAVENFDYVNLHICKVDPFTMVKYLENRPGNTVPGSSLDCIDTKTAVIDIPPKLWVNNYFQVDLADYFPDTRGQYILTFSHPSYTNWQKAPMYERTYVSVTEMAVVVKAVNWSKYDDAPNVTGAIVDAVDPQGGLYWVSRIGTLTPIAGATVQVVNNPGNRGETPVIEDSATTDANGIAKFPLIRDIVGAIVKSGADSAVVSRWTDLVNYASNANTNHRIYMYTDRPIYRPGQEVFIKGIYRLSFDGVYKIDDEIVIDIKVHDSKGEVIYTKKATVNKFGTFSASLKLPQDAALGGYYISALNGYANFSVEEYVGAAFEAKAETKKDEYVSGDTADIDVSGMYYFGVPVSSGTVEYSFTAQNYYFDRYTDEYFSFGKGWYGCYDCGYGDSFVKSGQTTLDQNGNARITELLDFDSLFTEENRDASKIIVFHATITDGQGKSVSTQKSFIVHRGDFYLGVKADPSFVGKNQEFSLRLKTVDTQGKPIRHGDIEITVNKVEWQSFKRQEVDGNYYNRSERVLTPVIKKKVGTDGNGNYSGTYTLENPGEYEISAVAKDSKDNMIQGVGYLYVYGEGSVSVRQTNNATLDITAERTKLKTGDTAKIIFQSPYPKAKALITLERGRIFDYKIVDVNTNVYEHEFPIESRFTPNLYASVLLLSPGPEIKFGQVEFSVDQKVNELAISVATDKSSYLPGEKVNLKITTTDISGKRVPAEVSVAVADVSVLALMGNPKKNPLVFFYNGFPLAVTTASNIKNILTEAEIPTGTKGGGGGDAEDLAKKQRGEFKDTAFWSAQVETDANGEANVSFTLPDNLTRWQIESLGITADTKVGVKYQEITAQKKIMLVPLRPRFVVPGDEFEIGAQVFNQSEETQTLSISYSSETLPVTGSKNVSKTLKAGESTTLYWNVKAPELQTSGSHEIVLSAKNNNFEDTVKNVIPINKNLTYEAVATANSTQSKIAKEYVFIPDGVLEDKGGLTIKTSGTLAVFLSDGLKYLIEFPYGCSEQLASKLSSIAIVKKGLAVKNVGEKFNIPPIVMDGNTYTIDDVVSIGLRKMYDAQTSDGGFSYYKGLPSNLHLTMSIVNSLKDLEEAGYAIDARAMRSAAEYISNTLLSKGIKYYGIDSFISGAYAVSRVGGEGNRLPELAQAISSSASNAFINEKASSMTLGYLALLSVREPRFSSFTSRVFTSLENRVDIDSRGAYVKSNGNVSWQYYETPIKDTALFLKAVAERQSNYSQTDKLLRWLLASRSADGAWGSTQNTLSVIDAFTEYLSWKKETESNFALTISLDDVAVQMYDFNKNTILSIFEKFLPISAFKTNTMHTLTFAKENKNDLANMFYYDMGLKYYLPAEQIAPRDEGITIERSLYDLRDTKEEKPLTEAKVGEVLKGKITITTGKPRHLFAVEDFIPAGFELVNFNLATEDQVSVKSKGRGMESKDETFVQADEPGFFDYVFHPIKSLAAAGASAANVYDDRVVFKNELYPDFNELHDDRLFIFKQELPAGQYTYEYYVRATTAGTFKYLPAVASELYFPENFGRTGGSLFRVTR